MKALPVVDLRCSLVRPNDSRLRDNFKFKDSKYMHQMLVKPLPGCYNIFAHLGDLHDELVSLTVRHLKVVNPPALGNEFQLFRKCMRKMARMIGKLQRWTKEDVVASYSGGKRKRYEVAYENLKTRGLQKSDARLSSFVKVEKWPGAQFTRKAPRLIQARQPEYNLELARYIKPYEERLYKLKGKGTRSSLPPSRCIAKGLSSIQRANLLLSKARRFNHPIFISIDANTFDASTAQEILEVEHSMYLYGFQNCRKLRRLLGWQIYNKGFTVNGVKYKCRGRRMSGDMNTACGNSAISLGLIFAFCRHLGIKWDCICDGDDLVLIVEHSDRFRVLNNIQVFYQQCGYTLTVDKYTDSIHDLKFCQQKLILTAQGYRFVRDYAKVLSNCFSSHRHYRDDNCIRVIKAVSQCEAVLARGVPILSKFFTTILRRSDVMKVGLANISQEGVYFHAQMEKTSEIDVPVTDEARVTFELAFGINIELQRYYEEKLERIANHMNLRSTFYETTLDQTCQLFDQDVGTY